MTKIPDPRANARFYYDHPPKFAIAVDEPWWYAVLALGADCINIHNDITVRGPVAIVAREQRPWDFRRDVDALHDVLKAEKRPTFDAYSCPRAGGKVVGLVNVLDCYREDPPEPTLWFCGPYGLHVDQQCLLPIGHAGTMDSTLNMLHAVSAEKAGAIRYALTSLANGQLQPGVPRR